jgi:hypothetical protein
MTALGVSAAALEAGASGLSMVTVIVVLRLFIFLIGICLMLI